VSSFEYVVSNAGTGNPSASDKYRHYVSLQGSDRKTKSGVIVPPSSGTTPYAVTGVGFQPELVLLASFEQISDGEIWVWTGASVDGSNKFGTALDYPGYLGGMGGDIRYSYHSTSIVLPGFADVSSFDSDGFTLSFPVTSSALPISYFCARDGGQYACGTTATPATSGTQHVTVPFQPNAIFFVSPCMSSLGTSSAAARMCYGGADDAGREYSVFTGSGSSDIYTNCVARASAMFLGVDADGVSCLAGHGFCHPELLDETTSVTMDSTGFTLDWFIDPTWGGGSQWFSWIAFENAEVGRFVYNHASMSDPATSVPLDFKSHGLIFYCNDLGHNTLDQNPNGSTGTEGATMSIGFCGDDLSGQSLCSWGDVSRGISGNPLPFGGIPTTHGSFGCQARTIGGFALEDIDDGEVIALSGADKGPRWKPHIYRRDYL